MGGKLWLRVLDIAIKPSLLQHHGFLHAGVSISIADTAAGYAAITAAVGRFDRSCGPSIESIGSVGSAFLRIFQFFRQVGELEICLVSKFQVRTTLGGRKNAEKPKREFSEFFGSVGSVFRSVPSILHPRVMVDRSANFRLFHFRKSQLKKKHILLAKQLFQAPS